MAHTKHSIKHKKELYYISLIVVVGGILLLGIFGPDGYLKLREWKKEQRLKQEKVDALKRSNTERYRNIEALRSDEETLEGKAREKRFGRENEIIKELPKNPE